MAKNLRLGTTFIRYALLAGCATALFGLYLAYSIIGNSADDPAVLAYAKWAFALFCFNALVMAVVFRMLAARKVMARVNVMAKAMDRGAEGDLTARVDVADADEIDKLGNNFNTMMARLAGMAARVTAAIGELRQIAADIRDVSRQSVAAAKVQSDGVRGTSGAVVEINQSVEGVAQSVESLSRAMADNSSLILEMSASMEEAIQHVEALVKAVDEVSSSIFEMAAAEKEIGASVGGLMDDAAATASMVAEMDSSIKQVEQNAVETAAISENVRRDAETGREAVEATIAGIGEIRSSSRITFEAIDNLSRRAGDIGKMLSVIDEVAEQTNLLALNASIIAAQAGEHGKGFAVVAEEIKELAKRTSSSTKEIVGVIQGVREETGRAVAAITLAEQRIAEGEELSRRSGEALGKIFSGVQMATDQVNQIARTTVEQTQGSRNMRMAMERVAGMVTQIGKATREQGHGSELIAAAAARMKDLTGEVLSSIRHQSKSGELVVRSTGDITAMIDRIGDACGVQTESSRRIVLAVEGIQHSAQGTAETTQVMDRAVSGLSQQMELLEKEMAGFRV
jgi:methyl-accepting chemotaxis protein